MGGQEEGEFFLPLDRKSLGLGAAAVLTAVGAVVGWVQLATTVLA